MSGLGTTGHQDRIDHALARLCERALWLLAYLTAIAVDLDRARWRIPRHITDPTRCRRTRTCILNHNHDGHCEEGTHRCKT